MLFVANNYLIYILFLSFCFPLIFAWNSILEINTEFEKRFAHEDELSIEEWNAALPTETERGEIKTLIEFLMILNTFKGLSSYGVLSFYPNIRKSMNITFFEEEYVIIHELYNHEDPKPFKRYFGYSIISSRKIAAKPYLHHSSPHFESDGNVCNQSAKIFEETLSRSLVIAGASRFSVKDRVPNPCQETSAIADAAHNNFTMFHAFNQAILAATKRVVDKLDSTPNYFLQWHGMSEHSCPDSPALISTGASGNNSIYLNASLAANKLKKAYGHGVNTPFTDPDCNLEATTNIFGRLIYGVEASKVCHLSANPDQINGHFIHIEQKRRERNDWNGWISAVNEAFDLKKSLCNLKALMDNKTKC